MFGPFTKEEVYQQFGFFRTNPMGSVINGDGTLRVINDLSWPRNDDEIPSDNSFVDKKDFATTWDDFNAVYSFLQETEGPVELAIFDWEKAYRQVPTLPSQWRFLCIMDFNNMIWVDTAVTFGGVAGCGVFGIPADGWREIVSSLLKLTKIFRWVDNNLLVKNPQDPIKMSQVEAISIELGVKTNKTKNRDFCDEQKYIGFIWNGRDKTVRLPPEKLQQRLNEVSSLLSLRQPQAHNSMEKLAGRLNHTLYVLLHCKE